MTKPKTSAGGKTSGKTNAGAKTNAGGLKRAPLKTAGAQARTTPRTAKSATQGHVRTHAEGGQGAKPTASRQNTASSRAGAGSGAARTGKAASSRSGGVPRRAS